MASKKKESEAFNLLKFMYQDDDDDMEDGERDEEEEEDDTRESVPHQAKEESENDNRDEDLKPNDDDVVLPITAPRVPTPSSNSTPKWSNLRPPTPQQPQSSVSEITGSDAPRQRRKKPTIVDYGHDDVAMSPEVEEGEILGMGTMFGEEVGSANDFQGRTPSLNLETMTLNNQVNSPQSSAQVNVSQADVVISTMNETQAGFDESVDLSEADGKDADPLEKFLPPPPVDKCSDELQEKINKFLAYKRQGKSFNAEVRIKKDYRNPDFLLHAVTYQDIDQIGSCFSKDVFDPHGYDKSDYYDAIEADMKSEMERKEQERKKSQKVEFVSGVTQPGITATSQKVMLPSPGVSNLPSGGVQAGSAESLTREGRHNKKSKWDKVDGDRNTMSSVGAHAALLSAANAGAGYAIFAQQKRREAEERRSSDRKSERRT